MPTLAECTHISVVWLGISQLHRFIASVMNTYLLSNVEFLSVVMIIIISKCTCKCNYG